MSQMIMCICPKCGEMVVRTMGWSEPEEGSGELRYVDYGKPFKCPCCGHMVDPKKDEMGVGAIRVMID